MVYIVSLKWTEVLIANENQEMKREIHLTFNKLGSVCGGSRKNCHESY